MYRRFANCGAACAVVVLACGIALAAPALADDVRFSAPAEAPMISLTREHGMLRGTKDRPLVQVFGDGRVRVQRPAYMLGAGVHEYRLDAQALGELVAALAPLAELDARALGQQRDAAARASGERFVTLDQTITHIRLSFDALARNGDVARGVDRTVSLHNVQIDAQRYTGIDGLALLARAERTLLDLVDRPLAAADTGVTDHD